MVQRATVCVMQVGLENHARKASALLLQVWKRNAVDVENVVKIQEYAHATKIIGDVHVKTKNVAHFILLAATTESAIAKVNKMVSVNAMKVRPVMLAS